MRRLIALVIALGLVAGCGRAAVPTPGPMPTQVTLATTAAPTLTLAPTALPSATPAATTAPSATPIPTATTLPSPTPRPPTPIPPTVTPPVGPVLGTFAVVGVYADDVLNIREAPGADQPIVGTVPFNGRFVEVFAGGVPVGNSWWLPMRYEQVSGWANSKFLARQVGDLPDAVTSQAARAILALRDHDIPVLVSLVHPIKGVTFSPYTYVRPLQGAPGEADLVFSREQLGGLWTDPTVYHWGTHAGSGLPIDATFQQYYADFVYDVDFAQPEVVAFNETIGGGSGSNNIAEVWPNAVTVQYYFSGFDPQYGGLDFRSLFLVLEESEGVWYLVGIVHDEWTP